MVQPRQEVPLFGQPQMLMNTAVLMNPPMERLDRKQGGLGDNPQMQIYLPRHLRRSDEKQSNSGGELFPDSGGGGAD